MTIAASVATVVVSLALWACGIPPAARPVDISTVQVCKGSDGKPREDGTDAKSYPCKWDCRIDGNRRCDPDPSHLPVTLYLDTTCQGVPATIVCVDVRDKP